MSDNRESNYKIKGVLEQLSYVQKLIFSCRPKTNVSLLLNQVGSARAQKLSWIILLPLDLTKSKRLSKTKSTDFGIQVSHMPRTKSFLWLTK